MLRLSVIVPCLDEAPVIEATLQRVRSGAGVELIVVDGGSADGSLERARPLADQVIAAPRGRARQMNAGAALASGDILLFLHADTLLPFAYDTAVRESLADPAVVAGRFDVELEPSSPLLFLTGELMNRRSRLSRIATGDQAIFVRRSTFERLGGFAEIPLMEDIDLSRRLKRCGGMACLRQRVVTSSRRWRQRGIVRTILLMWSLRLLYFLGVQPQTLARVYLDVR